jgi:hypothetical protein
VPEFLTLAIAVEDGQAALLIKAPLFVFACTFLWLASSGTLFRFHHLPPQPYNSFL